MPASAVEATFDPQRLARAAALKRRRQADLRPENVNVDAEDSLVGLSFYFCRSAGITLADREVEFRLDLHDTSVSGKFRLKDMVFEGRLEL